MSSNQKRKSPGVSVGQTLTGNYTTMSYVNQQIDSVIDGSYHIKGDVVLEHDDGSETNVAKFIKDISERFCVLQPNFEAMEEYPALKDAYDQYKMLEKLLMENKNVKKD